MKPWQVDDVMTRKVVAVRQETPYRDVVDVLLRHRISAVPVTDGANVIVGVVSEADLLLKVAAQEWRDPAKRAKADGRTAGDVMTAPAVTTQASLAVAAAARRMHGAQVKRLPVADERGRLIGIVTRSDLLKVQLRSDAEIRHEVYEDVLRAVPAEETGRLRAGAEAGVVRLYGHTRLRSTAVTAAARAARIRGVVAVIDEITSESAG